MEAEVLKKETLLQLVLDNIPSYVFWKDRNSIYLGCNQNFADSAGLNTPDEIIGKSDYEMPWSKEESDFFRQIDRQVMDSKMPQINFEEPQTIRDGSVRWLRTSKIPLYDSKQNVIGILGAYEDITERKLMELELVERNKNLYELNSKLESVNVDLEQFAYSISHDLKEPIRMIGGFSGLLEKRYVNVLDEAGREYINFIKEGSQRMSSLISQILSYTKIEKIDEQTEEVNFGVLFDNLLKDLDTFIKIRKAKIMLTLPQKEIVCQSARINMLFHNLITNGIKFNESKTPLININYVEREDEWYFKVSDNGIGIEENYEDYIFKPFKRLNNREKFPGNGIGLSICKRIIELHGGKIWYTDNEPNGTTFHFTISKIDPFKGL